jgi:ankyrin repeat protein
LLLDRGADVEAKVVNDWRPILAAAMTGNVAIMKILLERGPDINAGAADGCTISMTAERKGFKGALEVLPTYRKN